LQYFNLILIVAGIPSLSPLVKRSEYQRKRGESIGEAYQ